MSDRTLERIIAESMTDSALADRLDMIAQVDPGVNRKQAVAYMTEAARRLRYDPEIEAALAVIDDEIAAQARLIEEDNP